jgi:hypothetical protein
MSKPASRSLRGAPGRRPRTQPSLFWTAAAVTLCGAALLGAGCGRGASRGPDATAVAIASIDTRLRGSFRLVSFVPEVPLEPMLASMLEFQYGTLVLRFDGKRIIADSPGVHVDRAYEIREPKGDRFKLVSLDEAGVPYESVCEFAGSDQVLVYSQTPPWKGVATIRRAP